MMTSLLGFNFDVFFQNKDLVFFGDDHDMNQGRIWLSEQISKTSLDIEYLGLEYIESSRQDLIDNLNKEDLNNYIKGKYKDFPGLDPMSIFGLILESKKRGIKVSGIEMPESSFTNWESVEAQTGRTKYISDQILRLNEFGMGVVLLGADHVEKDNNNVYCLITGEKTSAVFVGGKAWSIDTEEYWIRKIELAAQDSKRSNTSFVFSVEGNEFPCDWVIHFPQTEKVSS